MNIGKKLKQLRDDCGMTRKDVADKLKEFNIDISDKTLYGYESGRNSTNVDTFLALCQIYKCNNIMGTFSNSVDEILFTNSEWELISKYRQISEKDSDGKALVDSTVSYLCNKIKQLEAQAQTFSNPPDQIVAFDKTTPARRMITYYQRMASAGTGEYLFDDIPTDLIAVPDSPIARRADFVLGVIGNSMEPTFHDGDKVFVEKTDIVKIGEIGIFFIGNECFIKEAAPDGLKSHNPSYDVIPGSDAIRCAGRVLGKVEFG